MRYIESVGNIDYSPYRASYNPAFVRRVQAKRRAQALSRESAAAAQESRARTAEQRAREAAERRARKNEFCNLMRKRGAPTWVIDVVLDASEKHSVFPSKIAGKSRARRVVAARNDVLYTIRERSPGSSFLRMAEWFDRDHTAVMHSIAKHAAVNGLPDLCGYTIARRGIKSLSTASDRET